MEEELFDVQGQYSEVGDTPGLALYIGASGVDNAALMQLAIHWGVPDASWISEEDGQQKRILRCWWETPFQDAALSN